MFLFALAGARFGCGIGRRSPDDSNHTRRTLWSALGCNSTIPNDLAPLRTRGARLLRFPSISEQSGRVVWGEVGAHLPFVPQRFWCVDKVPPHGVPGNHAHRALQEILLCASGSCTVTLDDGINRDEVVLDLRDLGLYIPALPWNTLSYFSEDAVVFVFASEVYQPDDYIRDYAEFLVLTARGA